MNKVQITLEQAVNIEGINKYIVDGLPLKTYDCSQITDGYAALILATEEGLAKLGIPKHETVEIAGYGEATDPLAKGGRDRAAARGSVPGDEHRLQDGWSHTRRYQRGGGTRLL